MSTHKPRARDAQGKARPGPAPRVIGLDLSLAATGVADVRDGQIHTGTIATHPYGPGLDDRMRRIWWIAERIWRVIEDGRRPGLVVVEGPSYGSRGGQAHERAGLWWHVISGLLGDCLPVAVVPPAVLKRYAVGKGTAAKPDMRMALYKRAGLDVADDGQVDAWWLAAAGLDHLGRPPVTLPAGQRKALTAVEWPEVAP